VHHVTVPTHCVKYSIVILNVGDKKRKNSEALTVSTLGWRQCIRPRFGRDTHRVAHMSRILAIPVDLSSAGLGPPVLHFSVRNLAILRIDLILAIPVRLNFFPPLTLHRSLTNRDPMCTFVISAEPGSPQN
jgi:hypothetical protein